MARRFKTSSLFLFVLYTDEQKNRESSKGSIVNITWLQSALALLIAFLFSLYFVPMFCKIAYKLNFVDKPDGKLKKHKKPTPYLGGFAIYFSFLLTLALIFPFESKMLLFMVGSTLLFLVGLIDDLAALKAHQKFLGQVVAVICFLKAGFYLKEPFFLSNYWSIPVSFLWMIGIINSFNLVDVMDGLATLLAITATGSFLVLAFYFNLYPTSVLLSIFLGVLCGFFVYNRPPAKIYLGDAGSLFIGGFLATIPFLFPWGLYNTHGYFTPVVILGIPLLEVTSLVLIRLYKKIPIHLGSPDHFSLYLQRKGWSKNEILAYITFLSIVQLIASCLFVVNKISVGGLIGIGLIFLIVWVKTIFYRSHPK